MKKIITLFSLFLFSSIFAYTYSGSFDFSHFPGDINNNDVKEIGAGGYNILYYEGKGSISEFKRPDFKAVESFGKSVKYIKSMKISNYWKNTFENIEDDNIDLSYLDGEKHDYPIIGFFVGDNLTLFIEENLIKDSDKETIGYLYENDDIRIMKTGNWYITDLNVGSFDGIIYKFSTYWKMFEKLFYQGKVVNFQIGGNPITKHKISYLNNTNNILQLDVIVGKKLKGLVVSLDKSYSSSLEYDKNYYQDEYIMEEMNLIHVPIRNYYKYMYTLPQSINSMALMGFYDTSVLSKYSHEIKYSTQNILCYKIGFKPNSSTFKKMNKLDSQGFYMNEFCIK